MKSNIFSFVLPPQISFTLSHLVNSMGSNIGMEEERPHLFSRLVHQLNMLEDETTMTDLWNVYHLEDFYR